ncbi:DUF2787 domain-containing protein [Shewanella loihica]|uniref:DUF2787 domain-containing protein n=1 Tax=Shewanella loihica (strain ATCC BAA-1088 / PV-4) TaxID=323850 RepID=A3QCC7_SHELP|nr:DUF2787 domain-containing protein [Shewanella loihica]ABO23125.1 conserved hypothetical protein [Shewanella loihica PV-4]
MQIQRETAINLPEQFYELLEQQVATVDSGTNLVTLNYRDPDYSAESGGYHPVEINLYRSGDQWQLNYFTDFAYCGGPFPELEKEMDVLFLQKEVYSCFYGKSHLREVDGLVQLLVQNFCSYVDMEVYQVQVTTD